jgi:hypothetical protein
VVPTALAFELQRYLELFPKLCQERYGRVYSFRQVEKRFEKLREGRRWLVAKDVLDLFDPQVSPFHRAWPAPAGKLLDSHLKSLRIMLSPIRGDGADLVLALLEVLQNLGIASLPLRFAHPDRFAIFSTQVLHILQAQRATATETFLAYCDELRQWCERFHLDSAADAGTALWTFDQILHDVLGNAEALRAREEFAACVWAQRRRVANVLLPFFDSYGPLGLARILAHHAPNLAGKIAGEEYERLLTAASLKYFNRPLSHKHGAAEYLLDSLDRNHIIQPGERADLRSIWLTRNRAVHAGEEPTIEEVEVMIERIERICSAWDIPSPARSAKSSRPKR